MIYFFFIYCKIWSFFSFGPCLLAHVDSAICRWGWFELKKSDRFPFAFCLSNVLSICFVAFSFSQMVNSASKLRQWNRLLSQTGQMTKKHGEICTFQDLFEYNNMIFQDFSSFILTTKIVANWLSPTSNKGHFASKKGNFALKMGIFH